MEIRQIELCDYALERLNSGSLRKHEFESLVNNNNLIQKLKSDGYIKFDDLRYELTSKGRNFINDGGYNKKKLIEIENPAGV